MDSAAGLPQNLGLLHLSRYAYRMVGATNSDSRHLTNLRSSQVNYLYALEVDFSLKKKIETY
jgi:hypothetical protein